MNLNATILILVFIGLPCYAEVYKCITEHKSYSVGVKTVVFDTEKLTAELTNHFGLFRGKITSIRKHNKGKKINLYFENTDPFETGQDSEYVLFTWKNKYRITGVNYIYNNGVKVLDSLEGNNEINCKN